MSEPQGLFMRVRLLPDQEECDEVDRERAAAGQPRVDWSLMDWRGQLTAEELERAGFAPPG